MDADSLKRRLTKAPKKEPALKSSDLLSTGSTTLNLALTGKVRGGLYKGMYYLFWGDSDSGKTFISMNCFAEASINKHFEGYRFIHDNPEDGALMDMTKFYGPAVNARIEPPAGTKTDPRFSATVEEFSDNIDNAFSRSEPFIYLLDSFDALDAEADVKKFKAQKAVRARKNAGKEEKEESGSYGTAKAKAAGRIMRLIAKRLKKTKSILIIICQAKDAIGFMQTGKTRSGGKALKFFAQAEMISTTVKTLKKTVKGRDRELGIIAQVKVRKNRHTGRKSDALIPIYWSFGIDDIGGCINYLVEEKHWLKKKGVGVTAKEFDVTLPAEELIAYIEENGLEQQLRATVQEVWDSIKQACAVKRKPRYGQEVD